MDSLLAAKCGAPVVTIRKSSISRPNAGLGLFETKKFSNWLNCQVVLRNPDLQQTGKREAEVEGI